MNEEKATVVSKLASIVTLSLSLSSHVKKTTYVDGITARNLQFGILDPLVAHLIEKPVLDLAIDLEQHIESNIIALDNRLSTLVSRVVHPINGFAKWVADVDRGFLIQGMDLFDLFNVDVRAVFEHPDIGERVLV